MRWEELFADLERRWEALTGAVYAGEVADRTRAEQGQIALADRLRGSLGGELEVATAAGQVHGRLARVAADFLLLDEAGVEHLVPLGAVAGVTGLPVAAVTVEAFGVVESRLGLLSALREITRDRSAVTVLRATGPPLHGTPYRVGRDYLDLAVHDPGEPPRPGVIRSVHSLPVSALCVVRRRPPQW